MYPSAASVLAFMVLLHSTASLPHSGHLPVSSTIDLPAHNGTPSLPQTHTKYTDYVFRFPSGHVNTSSLLTELEPYGFNMTHLHHSFSGSGNINGFSALMSEHCVNVLRNMTLQGGVKIEPVKIFTNQASFPPEKITIHPRHTHTRQHTHHSRNPTKRKISSSDPLPDPNSPETQSHATWGLQRLSQPNALSVSSQSDVFSTNFQFNYQESAGEGVDIYILDTGINHRHKDFNGRAKLGYVAPSLLNDPNEGSEDLNGHGTHCAGTAGSTTYGVAKLANIIGVKIMNRNSTGATPDMISGIDYMIARHRLRMLDKNFKGSVASMSFGLDIAAGDISNPSETARSESLDDAIKLANAEGIHTVIAAGNQDINACRISPAALSRETDQSTNYTGTIITVGASTISDDRASFSNFGGCITTYAPGEGILSTYIGSDTATAVMKGTSMATPYVAGLVAYFLGMDKNRSLKTDVVGMKKLVMNTAIKGVLGNVGDQDDTGLLAFNGGGDD
ncbi:Cerevisin [Dactylella cylindrospora]|nr:Cerevisin [Dactylella cylindrospora]